MGPHTGNFAEHVALLRAADALAVVEDGPALARFVTDLLADPQRRAAMGQRAAASVLSQGDLVSHTIEVLRQLPGLVSGSWSPPRETALAAPPRG